MASTNAPRDANYIPAALFAKSSATTEVEPGQINSATGRILVDSAGGGSGTVTSVSVVTANGFAGSVADPTTTPAITISTTVTGIIKGNGTAISAATAGTDYTDLAFKTYSVSGQSDIVADTAADTFTFAAGTGITLTTNAGTDTLTITGTAGTVTAVSVVSANGFAGSSSGGATPALTLSTTITGILKGDGTAISAATAGTDYTALAFKTWSVAGQSDVVADSASDTMTFVAGSNMTITTDATTDTITFASSGGSGLTVGTTTITSGTTTRILYDNAGVLGEYTLTGTGTVAVMQNTPTLTTPVLGVATATSINKVAITAPATSATLTIADGKTLTANSTLTLAGTDSKTLTVSNSGTLAGGDAFTLAIAASKTLTVSNSLTLAGTDSTTMTFPSTSATVARTDAAQTFTGSQTFSQVLTTSNAITASSNAATVPVTSKINTVTNNSAATLTITMTTTSAIDGQISIVRILDSSAAAQTITWVNTENSQVAAPTTSNGSTTLPLTVGFMFNNATTKWRCVSYS